MTTSYISAEQRIQDLFSPYTEKLSPNPSPYASPRCSPLPSSRFAIHRNRSSTNTVLKNNTEKNPYTFATEHHAQQQIIHDNKPQPPSKLSIVPISASLKNKPNFYITSPRRTYWTPTTSTINLKKKKKKRANSKPSITNHQSSIHQQQRMVNLENIQNSIGLLFDPLRRDSISDLPTDELIADSLLLPTPVSALSFDRELKQNNRSVHQPQKQRNNNYTNGRAANNSNSEYIYYDNDIDDGKRNSLEISIQEIADNSELLIEKFDTQVGIYVKYGQNVQISGQRLTIVIREQNECIKQLSNELNRKNADIARLQDLLNTKNGRNLRSRRSSKVLDSKVIASTITMVNELQSVKNQLEFYKSKYEQLRSVGGVHVLNDIGYEEILDGLPLESNEY